MNDTEAECQATMNRTGGIIAVALTLLLGGLICALVFAEVPDANQNALLIVIGIVSANLSTVVNFYFGSSQVSRSKDATIQMQADTVNKAQTALPPVAGAVPAVEVEPGESVVVAGTEGKP